MTIRRHHHHVQILFLKSAGRFDQQDETIIGTKYTVDVLCHYSDRMILAIEYSLTARVKELKIILEELDVWAQSLHCNTIDRYSNNVIIQNKRRDYQCNLVKKK